MTVCHCVCSVSPYRSKKWIISVIGPVTPILVRYGARLFLNENGNDPFLVRTVSCKKRYDTRLDGHGYKFGSIKISRIRFEETAYLLRYFNK